MSPLELRWDEKDEQPVVKKLQLKNSGYFEAPVAKYDSLGETSLPGGYPDKWVNRLILGDNLYILKALLKEFREKVKLIYIDPPFATEGNFSYKVQIKHTEKSEVKHEGKEIMERAYKDKWGGTLSSFLTMLRKRLIIMKELLSDDGSIYIHIDYHSSHYVKVLMDEIFGPENFQREITWNTQALNVAGFKVQARNWIRASDILLFYTKSDKFTFNKQFIPRNKVFIKKHYKKEDEGGLYRITRRGNKVYMGEDPGDPVTTVWNDILSFNYVAPANLEGEGYPTQKPEALLARIIEASSNEGDLIADFFCGSGTTAVAAEKLGRRWICCDLSRYGIHIAKKRVLDIVELKGYKMKDYMSPFRPFMLQTLKDYQITKVSDESLYENQDYLKILSNMLGMTREESYAPFFYVKDNSIVYLNLPDTDLTKEHLQEIVVNSRKMSGFSSLDILIWDISDDVYKIVEELIKQESMEIRIKKLPDDFVHNLTNEVYRPKLYDIYACKIGLKVSDENKRVLIKLLNIDIEHNDFVNDKIKQKVKDYSDYIDYWAIDYDYNGKEFRPDWYSFKTRKRRKRRSMKLKSTHVYDSSEKHTILIKIVDIFGNEYIRKSIITTT
ncbi:MAG: site-specific DNA-methyltransferase [Promethearchaeota archaeon]